MADPSAAPPRELDFVAAGLSYLFPGLGQVIQGRIGKGLMFFVCLYGLFFYGLSLGQMRNVWLPDARTLPDGEILGVKLTGVPKAIYYRPQFLGQFWIGVAAWPAVIQHVATTAPDQADAKDLSVIGGYMRTPTEDELNSLQRDGNKRWDLGWVYTLIAGVLNVLVIYDALAGPAVRDDENADGRPTPAGGGGVSLFAASIYWDLPVLLVVVSLVYSGTRHDRWDRILLEAGGWGLRIVGFLAMIGGALYVLSTYAEWRYVLLGLMIAATAVYSVVTHYYARAHAKKSATVPSR